MVTRISRRGTTQKHIKNEDFEEMGLGEKRGKTCEIAGNWFFGGIVSQRNTDKWKQNQNNQNEKHVLGEQQQQK